MAKSLYISKPGGAILAHEDGEHVNYQYGQKVDLDVLSAAQRNHLSHVTQAKAPEDAPPQPSDANLRAAQIEAAQVNTTASPVPGNYDELSEDQAVRLIGVVTDPSAQSAIVAYEMAHQGREKVIAAATDDARAEAEVRAIVAEHEATAMNKAGEPPKGVSDPKTDPAGAGPGDHRPVGPNPHPVGPGATPAPTSTGE